MSEDKKFIFDTRKSATEHLGEERMQELAQKVNAAFSFEEPSATLYVIEPEDGKHVVYSKVIRANKASGEDHEFKNFVAEADTPEQAQAIVARLKGL